MRDAVRLAVLAATTVTFLGTLLACTEAVQSAPLYREVPMPDTVSRCDKFVAPEDVDWVSVEPCESAGDVKASRRAYIPEGALVEVLGLHETFGALCIVRESDQSSSSAIAKGAAFFISTGELLSWRERRDRETARLDARNSAGLKILREYEDVVAASKKK